MSIESKQLVNLSKIYQEAVYGGAKKEAPKDTRLVVTAADKKANTKAYQNYKSGNKAYKAADHLGEKYKAVTNAPDSLAKMNQRYKPVKKKEPTDTPFKDRLKTEDSQYGYDKKGDSLNPVDKMKKERKKDELTGSPNVKKEGFVNWREDLKEVPDYGKIPLTTKQRNEKISEKNIKNTVKINPEMKEGVEIISEKEVDVGESYEATKTKEVISAFKRDPKVRKRFEKAAKKEKGPGTVKNRAADDMLQTAKDTAKRKGDTSKSDDRYAYESKLWDEVAANLTELGELNNARFKVEGYQRDPEKGEAEAKKADKRSAKQKRMDSPDKGINSRAFKEFMRSRGM